MQLSNLKHYLQAITLKVDLMINMKLFHEVKCWDYYMDPTEVQRR